MNLQIKHLAPYLPYSVTFMAHGHEYVLTTDNLARRDKTRTLKQIKLRLRPLSQLTQEIEHNGERFVPALVLGELAMSKENIDQAIKNSNSFSIDYKIVKKPFGKILKVSRLDTWILIISLDEPERCKYYIVQKLLEWHFDIFNLIENNLAEAIE